MTPTDPKPYGEVYVITCTLNGKQYVGQTTRGAGKRWKEHQINSRRHHSHFHHSLKLYGASNFTMNVVDRADTVEELDEKERHWISVLGTLTPNGFNLTTGGDTAHGKQHSLETRWRIAAAARDRAPRQQSTETRERIGQAHTGMTRSPEAKARMSAAAKNRPPVSPETRAKMSAARKGKTHSPETRAKMIESRRARE